MKIRLMHPAVGEIAFPLKPGGSLVIGRVGTMTDVEISWDPRISRRHCRLWEKDGRVWFQDLASRNGSWVGSERVSGVMRLAPGASVLVGETVLLLPEQGGSDDLPEVVEETHERPLTQDEVVALERTQDRAPLPRNNTVPARTAAAPLEVSAERRASAHEPTSRPHRSSSGSWRLPEGSTMDLRRSNDGGESLRDPEPKRLVRAGPRFVSSTRVKVRARDREDLRDLWMRDISKGGVFVETRKPPVAGTSLEVHLETPAGTIQLNGTVVHVLTQEMASSFGGQPGVGIQFTDLDPATRDAIQAYIEGIAEQLQGGSSDLERMSESESDEIIKMARKFLRDTEKSDFYSALDIPPTVSGQKIEEVTSALHRRLSEASQKIPPPQAARLEAALNVLGRVRRILTHMEGRLEYDFRNGHIRAKERIKNARDGKDPSLSLLRQAWNRVFPERVDRAALLTRKAFASRQRQDLAQAIDHGRAALELNPFFDELKQTVEVWESAGEVNG